MATPGTTNGEYGCGRKIKQEVESFVEENDTHNSEEKYDALQVITSRNEFYPEQIKSEDTDVGYHDLKFECKEEMKEGLYCEVCGGNVLSPKDFFSPVTLKGSCNCQCQNESNAMQDPEEFHFQIKEETKEEEVINESMKEMKEIFSSVYYSNSISESRIHEGNEICSRNMKERTDVISVENQHTEKLPLNHEICTSFETSDLKSHKKNHSDTKPFQCEICSKSFTAKNSLKLHERIHTGDKPFQCKICSKSFSYNSNLKTHEKNHTGDKVFQCKICSKSFIHRGDLKIHEKIHSGDKSFKCKICSKSFIQRGTLKSHERIHTGERPFQCKVCSKSFTEKSNLKKHEKIHTGDKPFKCKVCSKAFSRCSTLKRHEKIHTKKKPLQKKFVQSCSANI
ncbi:uncharacterized protein [Leptinotarsa decemlineata]|uniref:uncharacterized protein n=1 Tax=Leptinotarsa decemlineata TaxID=7539 RepID=UPI003D30B448